MRIGYVLDRFPSPYQTFVLQELLALEERGLTLHVFSLGPAGHPVHEDVARLRASVTYLPPLGNTKVYAGLALAALAQGPWPFGSTLRLALLARRRLALAGWLRGLAIAPASRQLGIAHLHAHFASGANVAAMVAARLSGVSFSFTTHAADLYARPMLLCETLERSSFAVTISEYNRQHIAATCGQGLAAKVRLVRAGIDPVPWAGLGHRDHEPPLVLSVGRLVPKKGHADVISAAAILRDRGVSFVLRIVGNGPERPALEAAIAQQGLAERVSILPPLTQAQLRELYGCCALVVLACRVAPDGDRDGIPVSLMEALAAGLPVVSTSVSGIPELVDEQVGILVPPGSASQLAAAIAELLADADRRKAMGRAGAARIRESFSVEKSAEQLMQLFRGANPPFGR